jgi:hypothetical protein
MKALTLTNCDTTADLPLQNMAYWAYCIEKRMEASRAQNPERTRKHRVTISTSRENGRRSGVRVLEWTGGHRKLRETTSSDVRLLEWCSSIGRDRRATQIVRNNSIKWRMQGKYCESRMSRSIHLIFQIHDRRTDMSEGDGRTEKADAEPSDAGDVSFSR